jgi:hypothetical protein
MKHLDTEKMCKEISQSRGIDLETVSQVIEEETKYLVMVGIAKDGPNELSNIIRIIMCSLDQIYGSVTFGWWSKMTQHKKWRKWMQKRI